MVDEVFYLSITNVLKNREKPKVLIIIRINWDEFQGVACHSESFWQLTVGWDKILDRQDPTPTVGMLNICKECNLCIQLRCRGQTPDQIFHFFDKRLIMPAYRKIRANKSSENNTKVLSMEYTRWLANKSKHELLNTKNFNTILTQPSSTKPL